MADFEDDDDTARKSTAGRVERATFPGPVPGIPTKKMPPRPQPVPMRAHELDSTPPQPYVIKTGGYAPREREKTKVGMGPPPLPKKAPVQPEVAHSIPPASLPEPYVLPLPAGLPQLSPSLVEKASTFTLPRLLVLIAAVTAGASGFVTAAGQAISQIITALKPSYERTQLKQEFEQELEPIKKRVDSNFGLDEETKARLAKETKLEDAIATLRSDVDTMKPSLPQIHGLPPSAKRK